MRDNYKPSMLRLNVTEILISMCAFENTCHEHRTVGHQPTQSGIKV